MIRIRQQQLESFQRMKRQPAVAAIREHAAGIWPQRHAQLGEAGLTDLVSTCIERAREYGLTSQRHWMQYVNLALALGPDFDRDGRFPWARILLASDMPIDNRFISLNRRVNKLFEQSHDLWQAE